MDSKKFLHGGLAVLVCMLVLVGTGCNKTKKTKLRITLFENLNIYSAYQELIDRYNRTNPDVNVVMERIPGSQIRTKIMNEGWASYWHEVLFLQDDRIAGHEVDFARIHAGIASLPRVGLNPYALGIRLFQYVEEMVNKGRHSIAFQRLANANQREKYDTKENSGHDFIFDIRTNLCDHLFIDAFVDQDFVDRYKLFVAGKRLNQSSG